MSQTPSGLDESATELVLQSLLVACQLEARITDRLSLCGSWDATEPEARHAWFHLVESGQCVIEASHLPQPLQLSAGELVVFPQGSSHRLCNAITEDEAHCTLLCGEFHFGGSVAKILLVALPQCLVLRAEDASSLQALAQLMRREASHPAMGSRALLNKFSEVLFVIALRHHLQSQGPQRGLFAALADPRIAPALALMHKDPGAAWTVDRLAGHVHLSRAAFAQRFTQLLGEPPMRYLSQWRMAQAALRLRDPQVTVAALANDLGFETEAAFRRAFKRVHGHAPGMLRRQRTGA